MSQVHRAYIRPLVESLKFVSRTSGTDNRKFLRFSVAHLGFLPVVVLFFSTVSADVAPETIVAYEDATVTLPCRTNQTSDLLTVEWSKAEMTPNITLLYRSGEETVEEKNRAFLNRTSLILEEVKHGNISQVISKLRLSDGGRYLCRTMVGKQRQVEAALDLIVGAASEPKLTFVRSGASGGLTVECSAERWFPEPEITFLDEKGSKIEAEDPRTDQDSAGGFNVKRRASLQIDTNRVTCHVHQPLLNNTRYASIYIPDDCMRSCINSIVCSVLVIAAGLCGLCFLWKKFGCSDCRQKSPQPLQPPSPSMGNAINTQLQAEIKELQAEIKRLQAEIKELRRLKSHISEKDEIIAKQKAEIEELKSKYSAAQQQNQPTTNSSSSLDASHQVTQTLDHSNTPPAATSAPSHNPGKVSKAKDNKPSGSGQVWLPATTRGVRSKSTPAFFTNNISTSSSSSSTSTPKEMKIPRSVSFSGSRPGVARSPRRYTMANPYSILADLNEESESLIH